MVADEFDFWFPGDVNRLARDAMAREAWGAAYLAAAAALRQFDIDRQPHSLELDVVERQSSQSGLLPEFCVTILSALRSVSGPAENDHYAARWLTQLHATLHLARRDLGVRLRLNGTPGLTVQPAGTLLVDLRHVLPADSIQGSSSQSPYVVWMRSVRNALEENNLARAGAEYAIAIDLPLETGPTGRETAIVSAFRFIGQIATILPKKPHQKSTLPELWLNLLPMPEGPTLPFRLRIWRLGYMMVAEPNRIA